MVSEHLLPVIANNASGPVFFILCSTWLFFLFWQQKCSIYRWEYSFFKQEGSMVCYEPSVKHIHTNDLCPDSDLLSSGVGGILPIQVKLNCYYFFCLGGSVLSMENKSSVDSSFFQLQSIYTLGRSYAIPKTFFFFSLSLAIFSLQYHILDSRKTMLFVESLRIRISITVPSTQWPGCVPQEAVSV